MRVKSQSKHSALNQPRYRSFVKQRDVILNKLYFDLQRKCSTVLANAIYSVYNVYGKFYDELEKSQFDSQVFFKQKAKLQDFISNSLMMEQQILHLIVKYRRYFYALAKAGEAEALGRVLNKKHKINIPKHDIYVQAHEKTKFGHSLDALAHIGVSRVFQKAIEAFQTSYLQQHKKERALELFSQKMPKVKRKIKQLRPKESNKLKEADRKKNKDTIDQILADQLEDGTITTEINPELSFAFGVIDESIFEEIRDAYAEQYIPTYAFRSPDVKWEVPARDEDQEIYGWQVEQSITEDFVCKVRTGQNEAAKESGINDFIWMVVMSEKTCECCAWRDGLTSSEIETKLSEMGGDDCDDTIVPPAHPNCYCTISPYSDSIAEYEKDAPTIGSADEWLDELASNRK